MENEIAFCSSYNHFSLNRNIQIRRCIQGQGTGNIMHTQSAMTYPSFHKEVQKYSESRIVSHLSIVDNYGNFGN